MSNPRARRAISEDQTRVGRRVGMVVITLVMLGAAWIDVPLTLNLVVRPLMARNWPSAWCTVESSSVGSSRGSNHTTNWVVVHYVYGVNGKTYQSDRYDFLAGGWDHKNAYRVVNELNRHPLRPCYFNPADPAFAVLDRSIGNPALNALIPLVIIAGCLLLLNKIRRDGSRVSDPANALPWLPGAAAIGSGPVTLRPQSTPLRSFIVLLVVDLIFCGGCFLMFREARQNYFVLLVGIPFALICLLLVIGTISQFLSCFTPRPTLWLSSSPLVIGEPCVLRWSITGSVNRLSRFSIVLQGREEVVDNRTKQSRSAVEVIAEIPVVDTTVPREMAIGTTSICVPQGQMHSLHYFGCRINWSLKVCGEIPHWPVAVEQFDLRIDPPAAERMKA